MENIEAVKPRENYKERRDNELRKLKSGLESRISDYEKENRNHKDNPQYSKTAELNENFIQQCREKITRLDSILSGEQDVSV